MREVEAGERRGQSATVVAMRHPTMNAITRACLTAVPLDKEPIPDTLLERDRKDCLVAATTITEPARPAYCSCLAEEMGKRMTLQDYLLMYLGLVEAAQRRSREPPGMQVPSMRAVLQTCQSRVRG